jgi:hypothetical protein
MSGLPLHVRAVKYHELLKSQGMCVRSVLAEVSRQELMDAGVPGVFGSPT